MNPKDKKRLNDLLVELMSAQDDVTHINEAGPKFASETLALIEARNSIKHKIIVFVDALLADSRA